MSDRDCAVFACEALQRLQGSGLFARILAFSSAEMEAAHAVAVFQSPSCAGLFVYDAEGSRHLPKATMAWSPLAIAKGVFGQDVRSARWVGVAKPSSNGRNRRLSPRENRNLPRFDLLMEARER